MNSKDSLNLFYSLEKNTLQTGGGGYHAVITHVGSVGEDEFYARAAARCPGLDAETVRTSLKAVFTTAANILAERQYRIALDGVTIELAISGSTNALNGIPEEGVHVAFRPSAAIRDAASGIRPVYADGDGAKVEVLSVEDIASHGQGRIVGVASFRIAGTNISTAGDDENVFVSSADGTKATAEVESEDGAGRYITAHLPSALPPGKGKVVLMTHGKRTPEGELHQCVKSVTIIAGETPSTAPVVESAYPSDHESDTEHIREAEGFVILGRNFGSTELGYQFKKGSGDWSAVTVLDGDEQYHRNEEGTSIDVYRTTVNDLLVDDELETGDLVKLTITNLNDGSYASIVRTVQLA